MEGLNNTASHIWVTWMECLSPPTSLLSVPGSFKINREILSVEDYLTLYHKIGDPVGWDLRLKLSQQALQNILKLPENRCFILRQGDEPAGLCEVSLAITGEAELQHFGLVPTFHGHGLSLPFLQIVLCEVFAEGIKRIWLHTDEGDSPTAQKVYSKAGFSIYDRMFMDPTPL
jgi:GNAT superfamily N-acetyltransferase